MRGLSRLLLVDGPSANMLGAPCGVGDRPRADAGCGLIPVARRHARVAPRHARREKRTAWRRAPARLVRTHGLASSDRYAPRVAGEELHQQGEDGVHRAKVWLEATTRITRAWAVYDETAVEKLAFPWPHRQQGYSSDLGGILFGGEFDNQFFLAECKQYKDAGDQGTHYDKPLRTELRDAPRSRAPR